MDKLLEALKKTSLSEQQVSEVNKAVETMIAEAAKQIEAKKQAEYEDKLKQAYDEVALELEATEKKAFEGYQQAFSFIQDQQLRLEQVVREYENKMEEGYQQAWEMLQAEQNKNNDVSEKIHEEYEARFKQMRDFMVDKVDEYLQLQQSEIYDEAVRDVLNDPKLIEHRLTLEKVAEVITDYLQVEGVVNNSHKKLSEVSREVEELRGRLRAVEHRNVRLSTKNTELTEALMSKDKLITEAREQALEIERKSRKNSSGIESGRGQRVMNELNESIVPEFQKETPVTKSEKVDKELLILSGIPTTKRKK